MRLIFFFTQVFPQKYTLVKIKVVSALVPERIFFFKKSYLLQLLKSLRMDGSAAQSCGFYFFPHIFGPEEYTLVNTKDFLALLPERIFSFTKSYPFQLLKKPPNGRFRSEILRFMFFFTHSFPLSTTWSI